jgi:hypothetical protein
MSQATTTEETVFQPHPWRLIAGTLRRVSTYHWTDVERFFTARLGRSHRVGIAFVSYFREEPPIQWLNPRLRRKFLPDDYGMSAIELARLLESWRVRYADARAVI